MAKVTLQIIYAVPSQGFVCLEDGWLWHPMFKCFYKFSVTFNGPIRGYKVRCVWFKIQVFSGTHQEPYLYLVAEFQTLSAAGF